MRIKMGKTMLITSVITSMVLMAGCKGEEASSASSRAAKQLVYGTEMEIEQVNPVLDENQEIDSLIFRGLTKPTETNDIAPDLAKGWEISPDHLIYTFTLRDDAKWEDGKPVTAEDVKFTLDKVRDPGTNTPIAGDFSEIKSVEVLKENEVQVTLSNPFPPLLDKLKIGILPKHLLQNEDINKTDFNQHPIGNGPFKLKEWDNDHTITLVRNDKYYGLKPNLEEIVFKHVPDPNTRALQLKTGEIDLALLEPNQMKSVKEDEGFTVHTISTADYRAVMYNCRNPLFKDAKVRQAMNFAIDREAIVKGMLSGKGEAAYGPLQRSWANSPQKEMYAYDPKKAKELLKEAGWKKGSDGILVKDGKRFEFELVSPITDPIRTALGNVVAEQLKPLGISVTPKPLDWNAIKIDQADAFVIGWGSEFDPDDHTYRVFHSSQIGDGLYNMGAYRSDKVDQLLTEARIADNQEERKVLYGEFQKELAVDPPFNFLVYLDALYGVNKKVSGVSDRTLGHHGFGILWNIEEWDKQ
ncbi:peptide ABC transporter substrate-binding protein [Bacillus sp. FJAT-27231]|uniref:ABC transporter substrate-binding protein n=1 Tax=Bacillus sp. FJAT-27231 TaxID=1679168 RepID=UPI0006714C14|nr:ABC transporter substrate-binding protein [Bacillus sp. FJAT-27231]KMY54479.1 peptide ABC transporter substrate-binding protein [Bacillus sp. FJAT-27231]